MTNEPTIREQSYYYFLQEAQELLQALEQELLSLQEDYSINKAYSLMRIAHTLKGAAATVGLETIKTVTHSLEDIFKALCQPGVAVDAEIEALLFESYECLRLLLTSTLKGETVNDVEIIDRTAAVFAQLQQKLGDCFGQEALIPTSVELGFDVTQSIFEFGVSQRLGTIATVIDSGDLTAIATTLREQAEIFFGLAESLNLPGFGTIALATLTALDAHPQHVVTIAQTALEDFKKGQIAVLNGDRNQGGQPSLILQHLSGLNTREQVFNPNLLQHKKQHKLNFSSSLQTKQNIDQDFINQTEINIVSDPSTELNLLNELHNLERELNESQQQELADPLVDLIWGGAEEQEPEDDQEILSEQFSTSTTSKRFIPSASQFSTFSEEKPEEENLEKPSMPLPAASLKSSSPQKKRISPSQTVRVNVENLEYLNDSIGELLTNQNRLMLQNEQLETAVRTLLAWLQQHQQQINQLQDLSVLPLDLPKQLKSSAKSPLVSESQLLIESLLENVVQLTEAADAIDLFTRQSHETLEKQSQLLTNTRDSLMQARMLPLGKVFGRFHHLLKHLEVVHNKQVELKLRGTEVLIDKVVVEKLYDPLLHLVRNAFDHGIESSQIRQQWGKLEKGCIEICAYHQDRYLMIEVRDDGQGLDFEKIRNSAVEKLLVSPEQASSLDDAQLTDLLFEPGFSTNVSVNDLSGRGIGLDVVRTHLQAIQGSVTVSSELHKGTKFRLQIPLSLSIAKLLLCQTDERIYAFFADGIQQILIPQPDHIRIWEDGKVLRWNQGSQEKLIPVYKLSTVLHYSWLPNSLISQHQQSLVQEEQEKPVIIVGFQDKFLGLEVDRLLGEQELVIRPLGQIIAPPSYIYGSSILADGQLALVFNVSELIQHVLNQQVDSHQDDWANSNTGETAYYTASLTGDFTSTTSDIPLSSHKQRQLPAHSQASLPPAPDPDFRTKQDKIILIVDDSITVRQDLAITLQKADYQVLQAKDGYEALQQLRSQKGIELVICDIEMPRMNGFEFLKYRQLDSNLSIIPVIILSSRSGAKHQEIAAKLGATSYITKPYMEHRLLMTLKDVLENNYQLEHTNSHVQ
jgi:chemotaxis family two-component system sensor histidine kinase/response regulator PixL